MGVCQTAGRVAICHKNIPNVISKITTTFGEAGINIEAMSNTSRNDYAYSLIDVSAAVDASVVEKLSAVDGIIKVRVVK